ncbi:2-C-methyl-D-erythritol 4-phosphate cytidylyltransferase [uncultured Intestinimonas sp.]|uniref:2-C-methyl-D-erythritol 4-phosphate cytidylyltransferase n=1 Tax=uncultured Intestinimonas sp. TaxID=1689265 RepID=UPI002613E34A|nr:2-C-methyl-D-erythritol 4-phosphate cytidylyltransferase [uncultured Intestinimonas sp.]
MPIFDRLRRKKKQQPFCTAVVPAAGRSTRMQGEDKMLLLLDGEPVLLRTLRALQECALIQEIVVVTREDLILPVSQLCRDWVLDKVTRVVVGGESRTESVLKGIQAVDQRAELIAIHDGARPFPSQQLLEEVIRAAGEQGAAAPAVPLVDTIKRAEDGMVAGTVDREGLFAVQTPQVFEAALIRAALQKALEEGKSYTDDCGAVEALGMRIRLTRGERTNLKITTPEDMALGMGILIEREG